MPHALGMLVKAVWEEIHPRSAILPVFVELEPSTMPRAKLVSLPVANPSTQLSSEERMYFEIYDAIMEHRLPAGTKLTEQALSEIYEMPRHGVRKVLVKLAADGLVDLEPNRGAYIASPGKREANEMFELRQVLEQHVMKKVAEAAPAELAGLRAMVERERDAYMAGNRPLWIRLSADFHIELAKLSGNQTLVDMLRRLVTRTTLLISTNETPGHQPCSFDEHFAVLDALEQRDQSTAAQEMERHLQQCACRMPQRHERRFDLRAALGKAPK
jgi:DNA-binding GntR family transcriptional regulator